ncbi:hypothetical protein BDY17DRAFT_48467 [Neohortaea acidophila]|uniref:Uncharacterized protein n=1 Tax=Neohortaea acidophila TaxID=245834 RepID=A0A6A6PIG3_9PEZI|nr:uncharacterized protein BDY17DRAFT_48467 [Neohortaea acidophila]KAF2479057.1 hypothetical protein BDY17DRAFT_48467 [Neohortaea acidophila]
MAISPWACSTECWIHLREFCFISIILRCREFSKCMVVHRQKSIDRSMHTTSLAFRHLSNKPRLRASRNVAMTSTNMTKIGRVLLRSCFEATTFGLGRLASTSRFSSHRVRPRFPTSRPRACLALALHTAPLPRQTPVPPRRYYEPAVVDPSYPQWRNCLHTPLISCLWLRHLENMGMPCPRAGEVMPSPLLPRNRLLFPSRFRRARMPVRSSHAG